MSSLRNESVKALYLAISENLVRNGEKDVCCVIASFIRQDCQHARVRFYRFKCARKNLGASFC